MRTAHSPRALATPSTVPTAVSTDVQPSRSPGAPAAYELGVMPMVSAAVS